MVKGREGERVRLYVRGSILGYKRSKSNQYPNTSLIQIEGVNSKEEVAWYLGKRMADIYKRPRLRRMVLITVAFGAGARSIVLMVIVVWFAPSSSLICPLNLWELKFGSSCSNI